jgi:hypothetical protein
MEGLANSVALTRRAQWPDQIQSTSNSPVFTSVAKSLNDWRPNASMAPSSDLRPVLNFASERQRMFERRVAGERGPWTADAILRETRSAGSSFAALSAPARQ